MDARRRLSSSRPARPEEGRFLRGVSTIAILMIVLSPVPARASLSEREVGGVALHPSGPEPRFTAADQSAAPMATFPARVATSSAGEPTRSATERPYRAQAPRARRRAAAVAARSIEPGADLAARRSPDLAPADNVLNFGASMPSEHDRLVLTPSSPSVGAPSGRIFAYEADRVYEVATAPLRVTVVTLAPGETVVSRAAGDTLRWQIGETRSGSGAGERVHVLLKPLERGLATNLVLATSGRLYLLALQSGSPDDFDQTVAWTYSAEVAADEVLEPRPMDARYRITPEGRAQRWTPLAVLTDGARTEIIFPDELASIEAPVLIGRQADGSPRLLSYRQSGSRYLVDEVVEDAELRVGGARPKIVRIRRLPGASR